MNPELKEKWVKALRSGRYRQAVGTLSDLEGGKESNCCLGVLCRVAHIPRRDWSKENLLSECSLSESAETLVGHVFQHEETLAAMNDGDGDDEERYSFPEIADYIEANL